MATVKVVYTCGCGYKTTEVKEAIEHSDNYRHTLTAQGTIEKPQQSKK